MDLFRNDPGYERLPPVLTLLSTNTPGGGTVSLNGGILTYVPPPNPAFKADTITYLLTDSFGHSSVGSLLLSSPGSAPRLTSASRAGAALTVRFQALPSTVYLLQSCAAFVPAAPWRDFPEPVQPLTQLSDSSGLVEFSIPLPLPAESAHSFFRLADGSSLLSALGISRAGSRLALHLRGAPNEAYKLQFRPSIGPESGWSDYPSAAQPLLARASADGLFRFPLPIEDAGAAFFRSVPLE